MTTTGDSALEFGGSTPIFRVEDMSRSVHYYVDLLGFENASWGDQDFTCVTRGGVAIYLCRGGQGRGAAWAYVGVSDARAAHAEFAARGVSIREEPANYSWALEFQVEDPDGNVLRVGSDPE